MAASKEVSKLKNRIVGKGKVPPDKLKPHPLNFRLHPAGQKAALGEVLNSVGWVDEVLVNRRTGFMLNGHLRREIALDNKEPWVPVTYVDLSPEEERIILASFDPISGMAVVDDETLASLLAETSLGDADLAAMLETMLGDSQMMNAKPEPKAAGKAAPSDRSPRQLGDRKAQVKPVLYAPQVSIFEEALRATGEANRGKALVEICDFYVKANAK